MASNTDVHLTIAVDEYRLLEHAMQLMTRNQSITSHRHRCIALINKMWIQATTALDEAIHSESECIVSRDDLRAVLDSFDLVIDFADTDIRVSTAVARLRAAIEGE